MKMQKVGQLRQNVLSEVNIPNSPKPQVNRTIQISVWVIKWLGAHRPHFLFLGAQEDRMHQIPTRLCSCPCYSKPGPWAAAAALRGSLLENAEAQPSTLRNERLHGDRPRPLGPPPCFTCTLKYRKSL